MQETNTEYGKGFHNVQGRFKWADQVGVPSEQPLYTHISVNIQVLFKDGKGKCTRYA